jgi:hypothetical protein
MCAAGQALDGNASDPFLSTTERKGSTIEEENEQIYFCKNFLSQISYF